MPTKRKKDLPLRAVTRIHLPMRIGDRQEPDQQVLRLQNDSVVLEGRNIEDIVAQLRQQYPDETHERFLHRERDCKAEQRKAGAMNALIENLAKAAVDELLRELEGESGDHGTDQGVAECETVTAIDTARDFQVTPQRIVDGLFRSANPGRFRWYEYSRH